MKHVHLPVNESLHAALMREAQASGQAATALVREALEQFLAQRRRQGLEAGLDAYIQAEADGAHDLDAGLEAAAVEHLLATR